MKGYGIDVFDIDHRMGYTHEQAGNLIGLAVDFKGFVDDRTFRAFHGNLRTVRERFAHVDRNQADLAVLAEDNLRLHNTGQCFNGKFFFIDDLMVIDVFCKATDAVAAHFSFTAVGIDDSHANVGLITGNDDDDTIGTDTGMRCTKFNR